MTVNTQLENQALRSTRSYIKVVRAHAIIKEGQVSQYFATCVLSIKDARNDDEEVYTALISPLVNQKDEHGIYHPPPHDENKFSVFINHKNKTVQFSPMDSMKISQKFRGKGLASYVMSELISIIKERASGYSILANEFTLPKMEAKYDSTLRLEFLSNFGIYATINDEGEEKIVTYELSVDAIKPYYNTAKIKEVEVERYMLELVNENIRIKDSLNSKNNDPSSPGTSNTGRFFSFENVEFVKWGAIAIIAIAFIIIAYIL